MKETVLRNKKETEDAEEEEKRLLESFHLHEIESNKKESLPNDSHVNNNLSESQIDKSHSPNTKKENILHKEEELLGGTFGDPNNLSKNICYDGSQKSDEENIISSHTFTRNETRHEPGPAFTNSSYKDGSPNQIIDNQTNPSENPFFWADNPSHENMSKLVV